MDSLDPYSRAFAAEHRESPNAQAHADIILGASAVHRLKELRRREQDDNLMLRIAVQGGGCSGFQYRFSLENRSRKGDKLFHCDGVAILCDEHSLPFVAGATIEFSDTLAGAAFHIRNPNAESACGCGVSFAPVRS